MSIEINSRWFFSLWIFSIKNKELSLRKTKQEKENHRIYKTEKGMEIMNSLPMMKANEDDDEHIDNIIVDPTMQKGKKISCRLLSLKCLIAILTFLIVSVNLLMNFLHELTEKELFWNNLKKWIHLHKNCTNGNEK